MPKYAVPCLSSQWPLWAWNAGLTVCRSAEEQVCTGDCRIQFNRGVGLEKLGGNPEEQRRSKSHADRLHSYERVAGIAAMVEVNPTVTVGA
jgi:hypothetical protein